MGIDSDKPLEKDRSARARPQGESCLDSALSRGSDEGGSDGDGLRASQVAMKAGQAEVVGFDGLPGAGGPGALLVAMRAGLAMGATRRAVDGVS